MEDGGDDVREACVMMVDAHTQSRERDLLNAV